MYYENTVSLIGCLGRDPEVRSFQNGGKVANLRLATTRTWKDRNTGEKREATDWHSVVVSSDNLVGLVEQYTRKGSYLKITGRLNTRKFQNQAGNDQWVTEVVVAGYDGKIGFLDRQGGGGGQDGGSSGGYDQGGQQQRGQDNQQQQRQDLDDEIPF